MKWQARHLRSKPDPEPPESEQRRQKRSAENRVNEPAPIRRVRISIEQRDVQKATVRVLVLISLWLVAGLVIGAAQLATLLPQYSAQIQQDITNLETWLAGFGISQSDIQSMTDNVSSSSIISAIESMLS